MVDELYKGNESKGSTPFGLSPNEDEYEEIYQGKPIRIYGPNGTLGIGVLEKISGKGFHLRPSLVNEPIYDQNGDRINDARIERRLPQIIDSMNKSIEPLKEGYIEKLVDSLNETKNYYKELSKKIGKWYEIHFVGSGEYNSGKIEEIKPGRIILRPYMAFQLDKEKGISLHFLNKEDAFEIIHNPSQSIGFEKTDRRSIERLIKNQNKKILFELVNQKSK